MNQMLVELDAGLVVPSALVVAVAVPYQPVKDNITASIAIIIPKLRIFVFRKLCLLI